MNRLLGLCALLVAAPAVAQTDSAAAPASARYSSQQLFDSATRAFESGDWATAESIYAKLTLSLPPATKAVAVVRTRRGFALARLGRDDDAIVELEAGLKALPDTNDYMLDQSIGHRALGGLYLARAQSGAARTNFQKALEATSDPKIRLAISVELASASLFIANPESLSILKRSFAEAQRLRWDVGEKASLHDLYGRALLNAGDKVGALREFEQALSLVGGMTGTITARSMPILSDLALVSLLMGRRSEAHRYVAFSGAGLGRGGNLPFPDLVAVQKLCGEGLNPSDFGIVQLSLREDGTVGDARTIYANKLGTISDSFADLVNTWRWNPETVKVIGPVRRVAMRVEVRCSMAYLANAVARAMRVAWYRTSGFDEINFESSLTELHDDLKVRESRFGSNSGQLIPVLSGIANDSDVDDDEAVRSLLRAIEIAGRENAPKGVVAELRTAWTQAKFPTDHGARIKALEAVASDPAAGWDALSKGYFKFRIANWYGLLPDPNPRAVLLEQLVKDGTISDDTAYKREAMEDYARILVSRGSFREAIALYQRAQTGFLPCSIAGLRRKSQRSINYPALASEWGVSGWALVGIDVGPDLKSRATRVLAASPPLIFSDVKIRIPEDQQVSLPAGIAMPDGCRELQTQVRFEIAAN